MTPKLCTYGTALQFTNIYNICEFVQVHEL